MVSPFVFHPHLWCAEPRCHLKPKIEWVCMSLACVLHWSGTCSMLLAGLVLNLDITDSIRLCFIPNEPPPFLSFKIIGADIDIRGRTTRKSYTKEHEIALSVLETPTTMNWPLRIDITDSEFSRRQHNCLRWQIFWAFRTSFSTAATTSTTSSFADAAFLTAQACSDASATLVGIQPAVQSSRIHRLLPSCRVTLSSYYRCSLPCSAHTRTPAMAHLIASSPHPV